MAARLAGSRAVAFSLLLTLLIVAALNLLEFFVAPNTLSTAPGRAAAFFENPNRSGMTLVGLVGLWLARRERISRARDVCVFVVALAGVMVTLSRSAILSFAVVVVADIGVQLWSRRRLRLTTLVLLACGALLVGGILSWLATQELSPEAAMRVDSLRTGSFDDRSSTSRYAALQDYIDRFLASPWVGAGAFGSMEVIGNIGPHNTFVGVAADFGIGGLLCFVSVPLLALRSARRHGWGHPMSQAQVVAAMWLVTASLFSHNIIYSADGALMIGLMLGNASVLTQPAVGLVVSSRGCSCAS